MFLKYRTIKIKTFSSIISLFIVLISCSTNKNTIAKQEQSTSNSPKTYTVPKPLKIQNYMQKKCGPIDYRVEPFYPIGWSNTGNFAYITETDTEDAGAYIFNLYIESSKDSIVWKWEYNQLDLKYEDWKEETIETIWNKNKELFHKKLNAFNIVQDTAIILKKTQLTLNKKTYNTSFLLVTNENTFFNINVINKLEITFNASDEKPKVVYTNDFGNNGSLLTTEVVGILLSPTSKTFALINTLKQRGWEGPPHIIRVNPILGNF